MVLGALAPSANIALGTELPCTKRERTKRNFRPLSLYVYERRIFAFEIKFSHISSFMAYQNRKRNFKTVQERYKRDKRNVKVTTFFIFLAILAIIFFNRQSIWDYLRTYFY